MYEDSSLWQFYRRKRGAGAFGFERMGGVVAKSSFTLEMVKRLSEGFGNKA